MTARITFRDIVARPRGVSPKLPASFREYVTLGLFSKGVYKLVKDDLVNDKASKILDRASRLASLIVSKGGRFSLIDKTSLIEHKEEIKALLDGAAGEEKLKIWLPRGRKLPMIIAQKESSSFSALQVLNFNEPLKMPDLPSSRQSTIDDRNKPRGGIITGTVFKNVNVDSTDRRQARVNITRTRGEEIRLYLRAKPPGQHPERVMINILPGALQVCRPDGEVLNILPSNSIRGLFIERLGPYLPFIESLSGFFHLKTNEVSELNLSSEIIQLPHPEYRNTYMKLIFEGGNFQVLSADEKENVFSFQLRNRPGPDNGRRVSKDGSFRINGRVLYLPTSFAGRDISIELEGDSIKRILDEEGNEIDLKLLRISKLYDMAGNLNEVIPVKNRFRQANLKGRTGFLTLQKSKDVQSLFLFGGKFPIIKECPSLYLMLLKGTPAGYLYYNEPDVIPGGSYEPHFKWFKRLYLGEEFTPFADVKKRAVDGFYENNGAIITHWEIPASERIEMRGNTLYLTNSAGNWVILKNIDGTVHYAVFDWPIVDFDDPSALKRGAWFKIGS